MGTVFSGDSKPTVGRCWCCWCEASFYSINNQTKLCSDFFFSATEKKFHIIYVTRTCLICVYVYRSIPHIVSSEKLLKMKTYEFYKTETETWHRWVPPCRYSPRRQAHTKAHTNVALWSRSAPFSQPLKGFIANQMWQLDEHQHQGRIQGTERGGEQTICSETSSNLDNFFGNLLEFW